MVPRPLVAKGKRWTAAGSLASEVVTQFPPSSAFPLARAGAVEPADIVLEYRDHALATMWAAAGSPVERPWIERIWLVYFIVRDHELSLRYERSFGSRNFRLPESTAAQLGRVRDGASPDDGIFFSYSITFDESRLPDDLRAQEHRKLAGMFPLPLCHDENFSAFGDDGSRQARYHLTFTMPDGEMVIEALFRESERGFSPAILCGKNFKDVAPEDEHRCRKCQTLVGAYPELMR